MGKKLSNQKKLAMYQNEIRLAGTWAHTHSHTHKHEKMQYWALRGWQQGEFTEVAW